MKSFADDFFDTMDGLLKTPLLRFGDEWVEPFRGGDSVFVEHDHTLWWVRSRAGYWNNAICHVLPVAEIPQ